MDLHRFDLRDLAGSLDALANAADDIADRFNLEVKFSFGFDQIDQEPVADGIATVADLFHRTLSPSPEAAPTAIGEEAVPMPAPEEAAGEAVVNTPPRKPVPEESTFEPVTSRNGLIWETWEDDIIIAGHHAKRPMAEVAAAIGRTVASVKHRRDHGLRDRKDPKGRPASGSPAPAVIAEVAKPAPTVEPVLDTPAPVIAIDPALPLWKRDIHTHLNALGNAAPWTPALDAAMLTGLGSGRSLAAFAEQHDLPLIEVKARFFALRKPVLDRGQMTIEGQKRLTETLKERAAAKVAA